jgi:hypothetical protein
MAVEAPRDVGPPAREILWLGGERPERHDVESLSERLARPDGFLWIDIPECDESTAQFPGSVFGFHELALRDRLEPTHVPERLRYLLTLREA